MSFSEQINPPFPWFQFDGPGLKRRTLFLGSIRNQQLGVSSIHTFRDLECRLCTSAGTTGHVEDHQKPLVDRLVVPDIRIHRLVGLVKRDVGPYIGFE